MTNATKPYDKTFQRIQLCGRLAKDPEIKILGDGKAVTNFSLVVSTPGSREADLIPCVAWGERAKRIADNLSKGALVLLEGRLKSTTYEDSENRKQFRLQLEVSKDGLLIFLDNKKPDLEGIEQLPEIGGSE